MLFSVMLREINVLFILLKYFLIVYSIFFEMLTLPNECLFEIFNYLKNYYRFLFSCLLVNRQWCRIVIPILWSEPLLRCRDGRLIKIYLMSLNDDEKAPLNPLNILPLNGSIPLFE